MDLGKDVLGSNLTTFKLFILDKQLFLFIIGVSTFGKSMEQPKTFAALTGFNKNSHGTNNLNKLY